jgi:hypothetical protein
MKGIHSSILISVAVLCILMLSCRQAPPQTDDIPVYTFPPQSDQPDTAPEQESPAITQPQDEEADYTVRNIVIDQKNSVFSIGIPAGQREETEVTAEKPVDFWFEYLPAEATLEVNGEVLWLLGFIFFRSLGWLLHIALIIGVIILILWLLRSVLGLF